MTLSQPSTTLRRFFAGLSEYVFQTELGVADAQLVDYVSDLLIRFIRIDTMHRVRTLNGRPVREVTDMLFEANVRIGDARREVHRHIGDFTLFWTGVYPEALREMRGPETKDQFVDYCQQGKRAYHIAATIATEHDIDAPADVLERLSHNFEMCAYGLREIRREWERRDGDEETPRPILIG